MIPSRGLRRSAQHIGIGRRRIELLSRRSLSTSPTPHNAFNPSLLASRAGTARHIRPQLLRPIPAAHHGSSFRFQSTSSSMSQSKDTITTFDSPALAQSPTDLAPLENAVDLTSLGVQDIPMQIGYLKALGLDYGYGPTGTMEWILEHVHVLAGTPWWGTIVLTAALVRAALLYPNFMGTDNAAKMATIAPLTKGLMEKMREAAQAKDTAETLKLKTELRAINKKAGIKYWKTVFPLIQAPIGFGTFILLRAMAKLPVPGLESGGILWFSDLTVADPYYVIPIATASVLHLLIKKGGETGVNGASPEFMRGMSYFLPILTLTFTSFLPSAIQLSFFTTGVLSYFQAQLFRWSPFRTYMNMTPLPPPLPPPTPAPEDDNYTGPAPAQYQPRIITVRPNPQSSSPNYEAPRSPASSSKPTLLSGLKKEVSMSLSNVQDAARKTMKSARKMAGQESKDGKRTAKQLKNANEYEKRRRAEESKKRQEEREAKDRKRNKQFFS